MSSSSQFIACFNHNNYSTAGQVEFRVRLFTCSNRISCAKFPSPAVTIMVFSRPRDIRRSIAKLLALLLFLWLLVHFARWSKNQPIPVRDTAAAGEEGLAGGSRADKPQFKFINRVAMTYDTVAAAAMLPLVMQKAPARDPRLINVVRHLIDPPPTEGALTLSSGILDTAQSMEVEALLKEKRKGFFVECGALDGERSSNSLPLEYKRGWTGILIEANPYYYTQLLGKNRHVWSINACLSPYDYATQLEFESSKGHQGRVMLNDGHPVSEEERKKKKTDIVPCFPLETILLSLNQTTVDYLSLDVEGIELEILKTIPFDRIDIRVVTVEYLHGSAGKEGYKSFMESKGFRTHKELQVHSPGLFAEDYVFVKQ